jgi:hypothetical protein
MLSIFLKMMLFKYTNISKTRDCILDELFFHIHIIEILIISILMILKGPYLRENWRK